MTGMATPAHDIKLTTAYAIAGREVDTEIDVISADCAYGMNMVKDFFAGIRDIVGGRSNSVHSVLRDARRTVLAELREEAAAMGADAVIGVDFDYHELSGGGKNGMLMVVATGTAVRLRRG